MKKRLLALLLAGLMAFTLAACADDSTPPSGNEDQNQGGDEGGEDQPEDNQTAGILGRQSGGRGSDDGEPASCAEGGAGYFAAETP